MLLPRRARAAYYVLPNLAPFDMKAEVVYGMPISMRGVAFTERPRVETCMHEGHRSGKVDHCTHAKGNNGLRSPNWSRH